MELIPFLEAWSGRKPLEGYAFKYAGDGFGCREDAFSENMDTDGGRINLVWPRVFELKQNWKSIPREVILREAKMISATRCYIKLTDKIFMWDSKPGFTLAPGWEFNEDPECPDFYWTAPEDDKEDPEDWCFGYTTEIPFEDGLKTSLEYLKTASKPDARELLTLLLASKPKKKRRSKCVQPNL